MKRKNAKPKTITCICGRRVTIVDELKDITKAIEDHCREHELTHKDSAAQVDIIRKNLISQLNKALKPKTEDTNVDIIKSKIKNLESEINIVWSEYNILLTKYQHLLSDYTQLKEQYDVLTQKKRKAKTEL